MHARINPILLGTIAVFTCLALLHTTAIHAQAQDKAQDNDERIELIMGRLPPANSAEYKNLLRIAGNPTGQILPLTKCEMWSVRRSKLGALKRAADKRNMSVKVLDKNWNKVFRPMSKSASMSGKQELMMELAMNSKSTMAMNMMSSFNPSMVEYALTKGMNSKNPSRHPMRVRIALNANKTITAVRTNVVIKGNRCTWRGFVEGTQNPVTIMWWGSGRITGTIRDGDRIYQLKHMGKDMIGVVETMVDMMPDEHPRTPANQMRRMKMKTDSLYNEGDASAARPKRGQTGNQEDAPNSKQRKSTLDLKAILNTVRKGEIGKLKPKPNRLGKTTKSTRDIEKVVIDVMVVYTKRAAAHYSNIKLDLIDLAIEETNESFRASKVDNVSVRLVHSQLTDYSETGRNHFDHVWRMVDKGDGFLEGIHKLRNEKKADVVVLVVDSPQGCGLTTRVAASPEEGYAVVHHECAATTYSLAHEIGHLVGTRHNPAIDKNSRPFPYGHGFVHPESKWRTMMSYKASCKGCPRLPLWSTPARVFKGEAAGDPKRNNARVIRENAQRVANFR